MSRTTGNAACIPAPDPDFYASLKKQGVTFISSCYNRMCDVMLPTGWGILRIETVDGSTFSGFLLNDVGLQIGIIKYSDEYDECSIFPVAAPKKLDMTKFKQCDGWFIHKDDKLDTKKMYSFEEDVTSAKIPEWKEDGYFSRFKSFMKEFI